MTDPDPRTAADDDEDASTSQAGPDAGNRGESAPAPAEGDDDAAPEQPGSPQG